MRILLFPSSYAPVIGGLQTVVQMLARSFKEQGHEVHVVTNRYPVALPARETVDGVTVDRLLFLAPDFDYLRRGRLDLFGASFFYGPQGYSRLKKVMRDFRPDVVNVHFPDHQIPFVLKLRREFDFGLVVSLHGHDVERAVNGHAIAGTDASKRTTRALRNLRAILKEADAVTACSRDLLNKANQVEAIIAGKSRVIHNGIDPARFLEEEPYLHPRPYVLALGRLTRTKGFDLLVEALAQHESASKPDLIIAGAGEEHEALSGRVERLGLSRNIHFFGQASPHEVVKLLNGCLCVVVPSRSESFGIAALEAIAAGKPVLATKIGGLEEFLNELSESQTANGSRSTSQSHGHPSVVLVEPTVDGIARGLKQMFELTNGAKIRNGYRLPDKYTWPHVARSYERVLVRSRA